MTDLVDSRPVQPPSQPRIAVRGTAGLAMVSLASIVPFGLTASRCDTNPPDDATSEWSFSSYCSAFHALHLFNYPDTVSGGGIVEGVFALPILISLAGFMIALRARRIAPLTSALVISGAIVLLLTVCALTMASATFHPCC